MTDPDVHPAGGAGAASSEVPPRDEAGFFQEATENQLWEPIEASGGRAIMGLKAPGAQRGVWRGDVLVDADERGRAHAELAATPGVEVLAEDGDLPALLVRFESRKALGALRPSEFVDYLEPAVVPGVIGASTSAPATSGGFGCDGYNTFWGGIVYHGSTDRLEPGDIVPENYAYSRVAGAWNIGQTGKGVTVAVLDTGVFSPQLQLYTKDRKSGGRFDSGMSTGRDARHFDTTVTSKPTQDVCNHGTRMASNIAAPRNGTGLVGVAYGADLVTVKVGNDVLVDGAEVFMLTKGIEIAAKAGARIIAMALGCWPSAQVTLLVDKIGFYHHHNDEKSRVLFIAAAGTTVCNFGVVIPAKLPHVVAATGLGRYGFLHPDACGGPEVDVGAVIVGACASGRYPDNTVIKFGGSSAATALVAGVAALIWGTDTEQTRDSVMKRLFESCSRYPNRHPQVGYGLVNALKAVGGKEKEKEKDKDKDKEADKLGPKEHDKLGPKESDALSALQLEDEGELAQRLADMERRLDELEGSTSAARPFIRPEERPDGH